ncbi:hypothetical protein T10_12984 [Trichinella papuae]|uniref:Uncharacterized protein n=1 Tax=Trichinella papuae TaxID=268474 RepID=A0A0V1M5P7_9BILA|nr:hypothetical protein T10_12984 [Trichinella papuae]
MENTNRPCNGVCLFLASQTTRTRVVTLCCRLTRIFNPPTLAESFSVNLAVTSNHWCCDNDAKFQLTLYLRRQTKVRVLMKSNSYQSKVKINWRNNRMSEAYYFLTIISLSILNGTLFACAVV